jgi:hypothetical protein
MVDALAPRELQHPSMAPNTPPTPSPRLIRALAAERAELDRHRAKLLVARESLRAELERVESSLERIDERKVLLERLAAVPGNEAAAPEAAVANLSPEAAGQARALAASEPATAAGAARAALRGPAIRSAAVRVLLEHPDRPEALHYREWFTLVQAAGFTIAGKDPLAVFLTQLSRSPAIRRGTQSGVYELDRSAPRRLRRRRDELHAELRALTSTPSDTADLAGIRARRAELHAEIGQVEKALEEVESLLGPAARERPLPGPPLVAAG